MLREVKTGGGGLVIATGNDGTVNDGTVGTVTVILTTPGVTPLTVPLNTPSELLALTVALPLSVAQARGIERGWLNWSNSLATNRKAVNAGMVGMPGLVEVFGVMTMEYSTDGAGLTTSVLAFVVLPPTVALITVVPGWVNEAVALPVASIVATVISLEE